MSSISLRTISKRFLLGNFIRQTFIKNPEPLSAQYHSSKTGVSYTLYKPSPSHPFSTSSSRSSCSNSKSKFRFIGWYLNQLKSHPVVTKTFTTSLIYAAADLTAQMISSTSSSAFDLIRTLRMAGYGLLFLGPSQHLWFNFVSKVLPKRDALTTFKKLFIGQAVYGPANATLFFSYNATLQGNPIALLWAPMLVLGSLWPLVGLHLFDISERLAFSWMLLTAGILCAIFFNFGAVISFLWGFTVHFDDFFA